MWSLAFVETHGRSWWSWKQNKSSIKLQTWKKGSNGANLSRGSVPIWLTATVVIVFVVVVVLPLLFLDTAAIVEHLRLSKCSNGTFSAVMSVGARSLCWNVSISHTTDSGSALVMFLPRWPLTGHRQRLKEDRRNRPCETKCYIVIWTIYHPPIVPVISVVVLILIEPVWNANKTPIRPCTWSLGCEFPFSRVAVFLYLVVVRVLPVMRKTFKLKLTLLCRNTAIKCSTTREFVIH